MALLLVLHNPFTTTSTSRFIRPLIIAKVSLLSIIFLITLATALRFLCLFTFMPFSPEALAVQLNSLTVSKFNISGASLEANWVVRFTLWNPNMVWMMSIDRLEGFMSYKDSAIGVNSVDAFALGSKEYRDVKLKISTSGLEGDQPAVREWVLEGIRKEMRGGGGVRFSLQMAVWATYRRIRWWGTQRVIMNPRCDLRVGFMPRIGLGTWLGKRPMMCSVPMLSE